MYYHHRHLVELSRLHREDLLQQAEDARLAREAEDAGLTREADRTRRACQGSKWRSLAERVAFAVAYFDEIDDDELELAMAGSV